MIRYLSACLIILTSLLPAPAPAADQTEAAEIVSLEIRNLSTSVDRLTQLLYQQGQQQKEEETLRKLDIAIAYLNFRSRRIEMLERDKQNYQTTQNRLEDIIQQLEQRAEQLEEDSPNGAADDKVRAARDENNEQLKMLKRRLSRIDDRLIDYDNQIIDLRNQLDAVEAFVERNLEL